MDHDFNIEHSIDLFYNLIFNQPFIQFTKTNQLTMNDMTLVNYGAQNVLKLLVINCS